VTNVRTMLVLGDVSPRQYRVSQFGLLKIGIRPRVRRVTSAELYPDDDQLIATYATPEQRRQIDKLTDEGSIASLTEIADMRPALAVQHIATFATFGPIRAVVMDEPAWIDWSREPLFERAFGELPDPYDCWVVRSDGTVERVV